MPRAARIFKANCETKWEQYGGVMNWPMGLGHLGAQHPRSATDVSGPHGVVRGWLHDRTDRWWALLVGAPPPIV
jgi:hypothetical protein